MKALAGALIVSSLLLPGCGAGEPAGDRIREPAVAGKFYPADPAALRAAVEAFLKDALPPSGERPLALLAPHAGYAFSGPIAGDAFRQALGFDYDLVVILGTNHTVEPFPGVAVYQGAGFRTPLGVAAVDQELARALLAAGKGAVDRPLAHTEEHSEEVQVPFVQVAFPKAKILPCVVGSPSYEAAARFGRLLAQMLQDRKALVVASSDLSHYPSAREAEQVDRRTLLAVAGMDAATLPLILAQQERDGGPSLATCACGQGAIEAALVAAKELGARRAVVVSYANSGQTVPGEEDRVVGYGAVAFTAGGGPSDLRALEPPKQDPRAPLTAEDKSHLLSLARRTLAQYFASGTFPLPRLASPALRRKQGAFVTLTKGGDLRGCIGRMAEDTPLALTVARMALQAALEDPRFPPVRKNEVPQLKIEISALTPFTPVDGPGAIVAGRDGVLLTKGGRQAVFLPQVAPEQGWGRDEMLGHLCEKAGMEADCWKSGAQFRTFQAEVFREGGK
jgi:AmmeMemoRadiSam system protein B/AmmeMemoRadiSam system protein A